MGEDAASGGGFDFLGSLQSGANLVVAASGIVKNANAQIQAQQAQAARTVQAVNTVSPPSPAVRALPSSGDHVWSGSGVTGLMLIGAFLLLKVLL